MLDTVNVKKQFIVSRRRDSLLFFIICECKHISAYKPANTQWYGWLFIAGGHPSLCGFILKLRMTFHLHWDRSCRGWALRASEEIHPTALCDERSGNRPC